MKNNLNSKIVEAIRSYLQENDKIVPFLMDILCVGKESIYRRLRGEVVFSFDEVAVISSKLGFSIDNLLGVTKSERVLFTIDFYNKLSQEELYCKKIINYLAFINNLYNYKNVVITFATHFLPFSFFFRFKLLTKFDYYKTMHYSSAIEPHEQMSEVVLPNKVDKLQKEWLSQSNTSMVQVVHIFDPNIIANICNDINYFYSNNLINNQELDQLQQELLILIDQFELLARKGFSKTGAKMQFYLLNFNLEATYSYTEFDNNAISHIYINNMYNLESTNPNICAIQKNKIESLKRYSILITQSAEMHRIKYFKQQQEYIMGIGGS